MSIDGNVTPRQVAWLIVTVRTAVIMTAIASIGAGAGRDAWISEILAIGIMIGMAWIMITLCNRFPEKSILQIGEAVLGKYLGKLLGVGIVWFFIFVAATLTREVGEFMTTVFYVETPIIVFVFLLTLVSAYGVRIGLEAIFRINDIFFIAIVFMWLSLWAMIVKDVEFTNLLPIYVETGAGLIFSGSLAASAGFMVILAIGMIFPLIRQKKRVFKLAVVGILLQGMIITGSTILAISIWGPGMIEAQNFHGGTLMMVVSIGGFLERIDSFLMLFWLAATFVKITIFYYCFVYGVGQLVNLEAVNLIIVPSGALLMALAMASYVSFPQLLNFYTRGWELHNHTFILVIPLGLLVLSLIRKLKESPSDAK